VQGASDHQGLFSMNQEAAPAMLIESPSHGEPHAASAPRLERGKRVLHVAGHVDFCSLEFLRHAVHQLGALSSEQWLLLLDTQDELGHATAGLPQEVQLRIAPRNTSRSIAALFGLVSLIRSTIDDLAPDVVHLHAANAALLRRVVDLASERAIMVVRTPHGYGETHASRSAREPLTTAFIDGLVPDEFFNNAQPMPTAPAVVATIARSLRPSARDEAFAQLAVSLSGDSPALRFRWIGNASPPVHQYLRAADIEHVELDGSSPPASALRGASVYVETTESDHFPIHVAHAMALGIPCVVLRRANRYRVVKHCQTGFVCANLDELRYYVALLGRDQVLREHLGRIAHAEALSRFGAERFRNALFGLYAGLHVAPAPQGLAPPLHQSAA